MHKRSYVSPQIFRVDLDHEQAILTQCSLMAMNASNGMTVVCRVNSCKNHNNPMNADSGPRLS